MRARQPFNALVTGANGFIGRALVRHLRTCGHTVIAAVRPQAHMPDDVDSVRTVSFAPAALTAALAGRSVDIVFHLAAAGVAPQDRERTNLEATNIVGTATWVEAAATLKARAFVYVGSCAEYGPAEPGRPITEDHPLAESGLYGASKAAAGLWGRAVAGRHGIAFQWIRLFGMFGPGEAPHRLIPYLVEHLQNDVPVDLTPGQQFRDMLYVDEVVHGLELAAQAALDGKLGPFNLCSGRPVTIREMVVAIAQAMGKPEKLLEFGSRPYAADEQMWMVGAADRFAQATGFRSTITWREGVARTLAAMGYSRPATDILRPPSPEVDHDVAPGRLEHCQICGSRNLDLVIDCGLQPLCDSLLRPDDLHRPEKHYPLRLMRCVECSNAQLDYIVDGSEVYYPEYPYRSGITRELCEYQSAMATDIAQKIGLVSGDLVVDVGSNDGTLLSGFKALGMKELGVEPTNTARFAAEAGIETVQSFFTEAIARQLRRNYGAAKLITATNVFAHMAPLGEVMRGIRALLDRDGVFVFENHYLLDVIARNQYDTIYHEHVRTYCIKPLVRLFSYYDMEIFRVERVSRYGGNIRVFTGRKGRRTVEPSVGQLLKAEQEFGLYDPHVYSAFRQRVAKTRDDLVSLAFNAKAAGHMLVGKACPGRCSTLLNYCDIGPTYMPYITEQPTSLKLGKFLPGKHIPIVKDEILLRDHPDYIVILAWHYDKSIGRILRDMGLRSKLVVPLPELTIWDGQVPA